jgi:hypothetical protein
MLFEVHRRSAAPPFFALLLEISQVLFDRLNLQFQLA